MGESETPRRPSLVLVVAIALVAIAGTAGTVLLQLASDDGGSDPGLQVSLLAWIILPYVLGGLVAWYRSPESRFGPLMIVAGFVTLVSSVSSANWNPASTIGDAFDLLPFAVFLHVFLAFPTGLLRSRGERLLVGTSYTVAFGLQIVGLLLGSVPGNAIAVADAPGLAEALPPGPAGDHRLPRSRGPRRAVQPPRAAGRPLRAPVRILVNSYSLALVLAAVLLVAQAFTLVPMHC